MESVYLPGAHLALKSDGSARFEMSGLEPLVFDHFIPTVEQVNAIRAWAGDKGYNHPHRELGSYLGIHA